MNSAIAATTAFRVFGMAGVSSIAGTPRLFITTAGQWL
jgi:hypothetical protein